MTQHGQQQKAKQGSGNLRLVLLAAAIGIPAALLAAVFLAFVHQLEHWLWTDLPHALGAPQPPWYLVLGLPVAGAGVVIAARLLGTGVGCRLAGRRGIGAAHRCRQDGLLAPPGFGSGRRPD